LPISYLPFTRPQSPPRRAERIRLGIKKPWQHKQLRAFSETNQTTPRQTTTHHNKPNKLNPCFGFDRFVLTKNICHAARFINS
jgi:hypothetical protein